MGAQLQGKVAVVTGSTSGIGAAIARMFAAQGARVVVSGRREPEGESVVRAIRDAGGVAVFQKTDVSVPEECARVCHRAHDEFGALHILVNNAGIFPRMPFNETTPEFWDRIFAINVRGAFLCSQAAARFMSAGGGGSIINIGSGNAWGTHDRLFAYGCSKAALWGMTVTLARVLAPQHIRVNWVTVGWVLTEKEFEVQEGEGHSRQQMVDRAGQLPMGEYTTEEDIAAACVYLASDAARHVTGANLTVGAGLGVRF
ncbi:MAG: glucose 1-dehydrogenase [Armatimonadota bacterium]|nr:glucose 1-dehydrogenase [Armatimonadota bacterium]